MEINRVSALTPWENFLIKRNSLFYRNTHTYSHTYSTIISLEWIKSNNQDTFKHKHQFFVSILLPIKTSILYNMNSKSFKNTNLKKKHQASL